MLRKWRKCDVKNDDSGELCAQQPERDDRGVGVVRSAVQRAGHVVGGAGDRVDGPLLRPAQHSALHALPAHRPHPPAVGTPQTLRLGRDRQQLPRRENPNPEPTGRHSYAW